MSEKNQTNNEQANPYLLVTKNIKKKSSQLSGRSFSGYVDLANHLNTDPKKRVEYLCNKYGVGVCANTLVAQLKVRAQAKIESLAESAKGEITPDQITAAFQSWQPGETIRKAADPVAQLDSSLSSLADKMTDEEFNTFIQQKVSQMRAARNQQKQ